VAYYDELVNIYPNAEMETKAWFVEHVKPDWTILDCGANVGYYTVMFARLVPQGRVYAFEPTETINMLARNIENNSVSNNVELIRQALGNKIGPKKDKVFRIWGNDPDEMVYDFNTIDNFVAERGIRVDAIKIDVDSFDFEVLQGAKETIRSQNPFVMVEVNYALRKRNQYETDVLRWMAEQGYVHTRIFDGENFLFKVSENEVKLSPRYRFSPTLTLDFTKTRPEESLEQKKQYGCNNLRSATRQFTCHGQTRQPVFGQQESVGTACATEPKIDVGDEQALIAHILRENPKLAECLQQKRVFDAAVILREWVSRTANICIAELLFVPQDPLSAFNVFTSKKGGVWCGGASQFFVMILRLFGIPAATYSYSVKDVEWLSHVTTLFCDVTRHDTPVYQMDAYLNYHFSDTATGEMLEFCELVQRIKGKEYDRIKLMESTVKRSYLTRPGDGDTLVGRWLYPGIEEMPLGHKQEDVWIYKDASPRLLTWIPTRSHSRWNEANRIMAGRSLEQFMLDMMLCNPVYGSFSSTELDERFRKRMALAYQSLADCEVNSYRVEPNKWTEKMTETARQPVFGRQGAIGTACATEPKILVEPQQESCITIPSVSVQRLHKELGFARPVDYPQSSLNRPLEQWKMEIDDSPIFRYIYRNFRPRRHLEFGTWQGTGTLYCLEECDATVWTINLPGGENKASGQPAYALYPDELASAKQWAREIGMAEQDSYRTDCLGFIGRFYLEKGLGSRVCQIYGDSTKWDISNYPPGFFDTALIDGGHQEDVVISDTAKAFELLRSGGLIMWHDFCPPVYDKFETTLGVMQAIHQQWEWINEQTLKLFWIYPSWILVGVKK
jgi:FkbM family methyltransferase